MIWRDWLRRIEGIASVRCDGDSVISLAGKSSNRWAHAGRALDDASPTKVEALDKDGAILRVWKAPESDDGTTPAASGGNVPPGTLTELAKVIGDISDRAAARHENAYRAAFDAQQKLVATISDRLFAIEKSWQQMLVVRKREIEASIITSGQGAAGEGDNMLEGLAGHVLSAAFSGGGAPAAPPNGKAGK